MNLARPAGDHPGYDGVPLRRRSVTAEASKEHLRGRASDRPRVLRDDRVVTTTTRTELSVPSGTWIYTNTDSGGLDRPEKPAQRIDHGSLSRGLAQPATAETDLAAHLRRNGSHLLGHLEGG